MIIGIRTKEICKLIEEIITAKNTKYKQNIEITNNMKIGRHFKYSKKFKKIKIIKPNNSKRH
jgi:hypothetical protein